MGIGIDMQTSYLSRARSSVAPLVRTIPRLWLVGIMAVASWALLAALVWGIGSTWQAVVASLF